MKALEWKIVPTIWKALLAVIIIFFFASCSSRPTEPDTQKPGYIESGKASFYARKFQSRKTASGERYDQTKHTAAHRSLPFGTSVKVTNIRNQKSVIVRINDRGPFVKGRIIDLSRAAFSRIAKLETGVVDVRIEVVQ